MALNTDILEITFDGTGVEIPSLSVSVPYNSYLLTGAVTTIGNYAIVPTGSPQFGTVFVFYYTGTLDITTNGNTFAIFGQSITQAQLLKTWKFVCIYNGATWDTQLFMDFSDTGIVSTANLTDLSVSTGKIAANAVTNAKLAQMADQTVKANISGGAATPSDVSISTLINSNCWALTGNSGTSAGTNFLGTTDTQDLVFKVNNAESGRLSVSSGNTSFGATAHFLITSGVNNTAIGLSSSALTTTGSNNTSIGKGSLPANTTGSNNTAIGTQTLVNNTTGSDNTCIGYNAYVDSATSSNRIALGSNALATADNQFRIPTTITSVAFDNATILSEGLAITSKTINTTAGDSATVNSVAGRFRKDTSGTTFTLTNSYITANSIIILTNTTAGITTGNQLSVVAGSGSAVITFETDGVAAAPSANMDINFWVIN